MPCHPSLAELGIDELVIVAAPPADANAIPQWTAGLAQHWKVGVDDADRIRLDSNRRDDRRRFSAADSRLRSVASSPTLVLIGPAGAGKNSGGERVATLLHRPFVDLDKVGDRYYAEIDQSLDTLPTVIADTGFVELEASLVATGYELNEVRDAPDRPGLEYVFIARGAG